MEMGYRDQQIRVAMELCKQRVSAASQLLLRSKGVEARVENSGQQLAAEVQEAVMSLDSDTAKPEAILYLATLLSMDQAKLNAASAHVDFAVVTELLCSILSKRGSKWPQDSMRGASAVVEILLAPSAERPPEAPAPPQSAAGCFPCSRPAGGRGARGSVSVAMPGGDCSSPGEPQELSL